MTRTPCLLTLALAAACGGDAPPPTPVNTAPGPVAPMATAPAAPPGMTLVTVTATSEPTGAVVTGGGTELGTTPLTRQVPIPTPAPGAPPPTFDFTFTRDGFRTATVRGTLTGAVVTVQATLVSDKAAAMAEDDETPQEDEGPADDGEGRHIVVRSRGGGRIYDNHTTSATARVTDDCEMASARVRIQGRHSYFRDLNVQLRGPHGVRARLQRRSARSPFRSHRVSRVAGKGSAGTWTLTIRDEMNQDSGQLSGFTLDIRCR